MDGARRDAERALDVRLQDSPISEPVEAFARSLVTGVLASGKQIDSLISTYAPAWPIGQMAPVDRNILRVAIFEIRISGETPSKAAINEAVELGKVFGSDSSPRFINGVLGSLIENPAPDPKTTT